MDASSRPAADRGKPQDRLIQGTLAMPGPGEDEVRAPKSPDDEERECRATLAHWPIKWRELWGRRANALEDQGLDWREAERRAFVEVRIQREDARRARQEQNAARRDSSRTRS